MLRNSLFSALLFHPRLVSRQAYALQIFYLSPMIKPTPSQFPISSILPQILPLKSALGNMKFGKRLKQQIEQSLPGWRDYFLSYKELKKLVRLISSASPPLECGKAEAEFVYLLNDEIDKFNSFFMEQEEDFIIHHKELQQRIEKVMETGSDQKDYKEELAKIRKDIVNFHGEMVLLMSYSNINYTGLAKILKKYDKRTGGVLRLPFIQKVLEQPFFTTDLISKLIKECESTLDSVFPPSESAAGTLRGEKEALALAGEGIFRNTVAALLTMQEMRRGSSTHSHFSLPPLKFPDSDIIHTLQILPPIQIP